MGVTQTKARQALIGGGLFDSTGTLIVRGLRTSAGAPSGLADGDTWYDTTAKGQRLEIAGMPATVVSTVFHLNATLTLTNPTTLTEFGSPLPFTFPANSLTAGRCFRVTIHGTMHWGTTSSTFFVTEWNGTAGTRIHTTAPNNAVTVASGTTTNFTFIGTYTQRTAGATGAFTCDAVFTSADAGNVIVHYVYNDTNSANTIDTTAANTFGVAGIFGASNAGNTMSVTNMNIEILN